jgi:hypothetical protein
LQAADRPPCRPVGQQCARPGRVGVLGERPAATQRLGASVAPRSPDQLHRLPERGDVMQSPEPTPVPDCQPTTARTRHRPGMSPNGQTESVDLVSSSPADVNHVHPVVVEQGVDASAVATGQRAARRRLRHRRGPSVGSLVATDPEGPRPSSGTPLCQDTAGSTGLGCLVVGPGSGLSEEPMSGVRSATLDFRVVPECPLGPAVSLRLWSSTLRA